MTDEYAALDATSLRAAILDGLERANQRVLELGIGAATTLAVAEIAGTTLRPYHVGDSSILVVGQRGKMKLQTMLHSPTGYAVEAGLLDEADALHHEERHLISNMVGAVDMRIEVGSAIRLALRDTVLLATDGSSEGAAEVIARECFERKIMCAGLALGHGKPVETLDRVVNSMRRFARVLVVAQDDDYIPAMLTALRA